MTIVVSLLKTFLMERISAIQAEATQTDQSYVNEVRKRLNIPRNEALSGCKKSHLSTLLTTINQFQTKELDEEACVTLKGQIQHTLDRIKSDRATHQNQPKGSVDRALERLSVVIDIIYRALKRLEVLDQPDEKQIPLSLFQYALAKYFVLTITQQEYPTVTELFLRQPFMTKALDLDAIKENFILNQKGDGHSQIQRCKEELSHLDSTLADLTEQQARTVSAFIVTLQREHLALYQTTTVSRFDFFVSPPKATLQHLSFPEGGETLGACLKEAYDSIQRLIMPNLKKEAAMPAKMISPLIPVASLCSDEEVSLSEFREIEMPSEENKLANDTRGVERSIFGHLNASVGLKADAQTDVTVTDEEVVEVLTP